MQTHENEKNAARAGDADGGREAFDCERFALAWLALVTVVNMIALIM